MLIGDAFAFVDPVFSSGVYLAMNSAFAGAEVVDTWLRDPRAAQPLAKHFDRSVRHGIRYFSWFIYRMLDGPLTGADAASSAPPSRTGPKRPGRESG